MNRVNTVGAVANRAADNEPVIHIRFGGRNFDLAMRDRRLEADYNDAQVKHAVAEYLEFPATRLDDYVVDRHADGNLTLRPGAVWENGGAGFIVPRRRLRSQRVEVICGKTWPK